MKVTVNDEAVEVDDETTIADLAINLIRQDTNNTFTIDGSVHRRLVSIYHQTRLHVYSPGDSAAG